MEENHLVEHLQVPLTLGKGGAVGGCIPHVLQSTTSSSVVQFGILTNY